MIKIEIRTNAMLLRNGDSYESMTYTYAAKLPYSFYGDRSRSWFVNLGRTEVRLK
jgi:hypothetical protein